MPKLVTIKLKNLIKIFKELGFSERDAEGRMFSLNIKMVEQQ